MRARGPRRCRSARPTHFSTWPAPQIAAMVLAGLRADQLRSLRVRTLVIHGLGDTLISPSGGRRTAELIPDAKLFEVPDMGHDRPRPLWGLLCDAIADHTG
jgi:pimeloyl-ACP methyl ester carboxylesterase